MDDRLAERRDDASVAALFGSIGAQSSDTILASISDGIIALDNEWRLVYANPAAARIWGRDLTPLMGKSMHELARDRGRQSVSSRLHGIQAQQRADRLRRLFGGLRRVGRRARLPAPGWLHHSVPCG